MIASFLTHYYEAETGPFRNICDLSDNELNGLITVEKDAPTAFNRFALGKEFAGCRRPPDREIQREVRSNS
jgi:succinate dehydrogenase flavin-adding protein (antitoxin of CptAB toxin-antitoxin module)